MALNLTEKYSQCTIGVDIIDLTITYILLLLMKLIFGGVQGSCNKSTASGCHRSSVSTLKFSHADNDNADAAVITVPQLFSSTDELQKTIFHFRRKIILNK